MRQRFMYGLGRACAAQTTHSAAHESFGHRGVGLGLGLETL